MQQGDMVTVSYNGKEKKCECIVDGIVKYGRGDNVLIRCNQTGEWKFCNAERLAKLEAKFGSLEDVGLQHVGREGKKKLKEESDKKASKPAPVMKSEKEEEEEEDLDPVTENVDRAGTDLDQDPFAELGDGEDDHELDDPEDDEDEDDLTD